MKSTLPDSKNKKNFSCVNQSQSPCKQTDVLAKQAVNVISNASKSLVISSVSSTEHDLNSASPPPKKKIKIDETDDECEFDDHFLKLLGEYDLNKKSTQLKQLSSKVAACAYDQSHQSKRIEKTCGDSCENSFPTYLFSVNEIKIHENELELQLKRVENSYQFKEKRNKVKESSENSKSVPTTKCFLHDSW